MAYKLLTIDDEAEFTRTIQEHFSARGFQVFVALDGTQALEVVRQERPDIILCDFKLPGMDGDEIFRRIRDILPEAKVMFISAFQDEGQTRERMLKKGAVAFFDKPLSSLRDLSKAIKTAVGGGT